MPKTYAAIACALVLFGAGAYYFTKSSQTPDTQAVIPSVASTRNAQAGSQRVPEGSRAYRSTAYDFSLAYPKDLSVSERAEGGGAMTVTFQNVEKGIGFQVFVMPYKEAQVSEERFKQDIPSGVRESLENITLDGATGAAFYSTDSNLGDTREVWIIRNGFLYEITTVKPLESWLRDILATWRFI